MIEAGARATRIVVAKTGSLHLKNRFNGGQPTPSMDEKSRLKQSGFKLPSLSKDSTQIGESKLAEGGHPLTMANTLYGKRPFLDDRV